MNIFAGFVCCVAGICMGAIAAGPSMAASIGDFLPKTSMQTENPAPRQAPPKKQPAIKKPAQAPGAPSKQAGTPEKWTGTYTSSNSEDYADGTIEVRPRGQEYTVDISFALGRAWNKALLDLTGATGKVENGKLCVYNRKKHVFTLIRQNGKMKLLVMPGMTDRDLFTSWQVMSPPRGDNEEPNVEKMKLDDREKGRSLYLQETFKVWE